MTPDRASGERSTAAVLWLMILLVFLPIMAGHLIARHVVDAPEPARVGAAAERTG